MRRWSVILVLLMVSALIGAQNCPCGNNVNLFTNGDFESGELIPAVTEMNVWNVNCNLEFGCYAIVSSASEAGGQFTGAPHGGQKFMFIDGQDFSAGNQPQQVWSQTVSCLIPGENYMFRFWLRGCSGFGDIFVLDASVTANGNTTVLSANTLINTMMDNSNAPLEWKQYSFPWTATSSTATFSLDQISFNSSGFDFGLDDIRLMGESQMELVAGVLASTISCTGEPGFIEVAPVNGTGPFAYTLTNQAGALQSTVEPGIATFETIDPGVYTIEITDAGNCSTELDIEVLQDDILEVAILAEEPTCRGDGLVTIAPLAGEEPFAATANGILWDDFTGQVTEGSYLISVSDNNGCAFDTMLVFEIDNPVSADFDYVLEGDMVWLENESVASDNYVWTLNGVVFSTEENPAPDSLDGQGFCTLQLLALDSASGCRDSIQKIIQAQDDFTLYVPNCITANADGINDYFFVTGSLDELSSFHCSIFNRWGEKVFSSDNPKLPWTANANEGDMFVIDGVYTYQIMFQRSDRVEIEEITGHLTVLR